MRRSADASSMAGCWEMYNQLKLGAPAITAQAAARQSAAQFAAANKVVNTNLEMDSGPLSNEVRVGYLPSLNSTAALSPNPDLPFIAVQVSLSKSPERNGEAILLRPHLREEWPDDAIHRDERDGTSHLWLQFISGQ